MKPAWLFMIAFMSACSPPPQYELIGDAIEKPLADTQVGDAARGEKVFAARQGGHCILCHQIGDLRAEFQGNVGPDLTGIGARLSPGQLRLRIADFDRIQPGTPMPSYFRTDRLNQVARQYQNQTVLSAQDIEDIIAYLTAQKGE